MAKFIPAPGHVEIRPFKNEGIIAQQDQKYEEMGEVLALGDFVDNIRVGDQIFFDSYACHATPEIDGEKQYFVDVISGGLRGIARKDVA